MDLFRLKAIPFGNNGSYIPIMNSATCSLPAANAYLESRPCPGAKCDSKLAWWGDHNMYTNSMFDEDVPGMKKFISKITKKSKEQGIVHMEYFCSVRTDYNYYSSLFHLAGRDFIDTDGTMNETFSYYIKSKTIMNDIWPTDPGFVEDDNRRRLAIV